MDALDTLLSLDCTVRLAPSWSLEEYGTGFFVAPGLILTCAHVVKGDDPETPETPAAAVTVLWNGRECQGTVEPETFFSVSSSFDLALVRVPWTDHPCVLLNDAWERTDALFGYGFSGDPPLGAGVALKIEAWRQLTPTATTDVHLKLHDGELASGFSGTAMRNERTGGICGIVQMTRGAGTLLGGYALPTSIVLARMPFLVEMQRAAHRAQPRWLELLTPLQQVRPNACMPDEFRKKSVQERWLAWEQTYPGLRQFDRQPTVIQSPLDTLWRDFLYAKPWHERVSDCLAALEEIAGNDPKLRPILGTAAWQINSALVYPEIVRELRKLPIGPAIQRCSRLISQLLSKRAAHPSPVPDTRAEDELRNLRDIRNLLYKLEAHREYAAFERCFLIQGSLGAGKTHFFADQIHDPEKRPINLFLLPLMWTDRDQPIGSLLLERIRQASGVPWENLASFHDLLHDTQMTVVIVLDDLQKWLRPLFLEQFVALVEDHTPLDRIRWLVMLHDRRYVEVSSQESFWTRYGFPGPEPPPEPGQHEASADANPKVGGWIALDQHNEQSQLGLQIFRAAITQNQDGEPYLLALDQLSPKDETRLELLRHLANPGLAWIALGLINRVTNRIAPEAFVNLRYIEFTDELLTMRLEKVDLAAANLQRLDIEQAIQLIAGAMVQSGDLTPTWVDLTRKLATMAIEESSQLAQPDRLQSALRVLQQMNLLTLLEYETTPPALLRKVQRAELNFTTFWHRFLAEALLRRATAEGQKVLKVLEAAADWMDKTRSDYVREGVWEFFLLLLDRTVPLRTLNSGKTRLSRFATHLWRHALDEPNWPIAAVWFAGPKASHVVHRYLSRQVPDGASGPLPARLLFALMYFADQAGAVPAPRRLAALQPFHAAIDDAGLSAYFRFIAERMLNQETDNALLEQSMWSLTGCEAMQIAESLAGLSIAAMIRNAGNNFAARFATLFEFLARNTDIVERQYAELKQMEAQEARGKATGAEPSDRADGWRRSFFREWALHHFCAAVIEEQGAAAYPLLVAQGWYARDERIHHRIFHEMGREASIAFGWWFRRKRGNDTNRHEYVQLVRNLARSAMDADRITAFYLILHTVPKRMRRETCMDRDFQPIFRGLQQDAALAKHLARNDDFVSFNLSGACP